MTDFVKINLLTSESERLPGAFKRIDFRAEHSGIEHEGVVDAIAFHNGFSLPFSNPSMTKLSVGATIFSSLDRGDQPWRGLAFSFKTFLLFLSSGIA
jgi:hypothetical protein